MARLADRLRRRVHVEPRPVHRQHRLPGDRASTSAAPRSARSRGSSARYAIVFAALLVPAGRWADAFGRKRAFLLGLGVFVARERRVRARAVGRLPVGARVVQAAGGALMLPTSLGLMLPEFGRTSATSRSARGPRRAASPPPPGRRSAACSCRPTGAWCSSSTSPSGCSASASASRTLRRAPRAGRRAAGRARRAGADRRDRRARRGDRQGPGMGLGLGRGARPARRHRRCCCRRSGGAQSATPAPIVEPAMLRVRSFGLAVGASVLFFAGFGAMLLAGVLFLTVGLARGRAHGRPDAVPGPGDGDRVQHPLGAPRRALRLPPARASSARCCSAPGRSGTSRRPATRRTTSREYLPGIADRRRRRRA